MEIETPRDIALLSKSQSVVSRFGFYSEYDIQSTITGEYPPLRTYWDKVYRYVKANYSQKPTPASVLQWFNRYVPCTVWIPQYFKNWNKGWLKKDFFAGLSVCFIEIPQGMAYAQLAGFPAINGLYASSFPLIVFTIFSSCKVLAAGPVAADSVLMGSVISTLTKAKHGTDEYVEIGCALTFTVGLMLLLAGILKLGFLAQLISRPVMNGFILTAACIVVTSQLPTIFGINSPHEDIPYKNLYWVIKDIHQTNRPTFVISIIACLLMDIPRRIKKFPKWIPVPIIILIISIILSKHYDWSSKTGWDVKVVGTIPKGLPPLKWPRSDLFFTYFPKAIIIALVSYMDGISMGYSVDRQLAERHRKDVEGYTKAPEDSVNDASRLSNIINPIAPALIEQVNVTVDGSQEMIAWGLSDLMGSLIGSQVISASFSRSGLLLTMEAHTLIPNLMDAIACIIVITSATTYLAYLPKCVLSAIVFVAAFRLFEDSYKEAIFLYKVSRIELLEFLATFILPLFITLEVGIVIGIGVSLGVRLWKSYDAPIIELGQIYGGNVESPQIYYANIKHWKEAKTLPGIRIIELRSELWFSNYRRLVDFIENIVYNDTSIKFIIICLVHSQITDTTSIREIISIFDDFKDITICLSHLRKPVRSLLVRYRETILSDKKNELQKGNPSENGDTIEYKFDDLLGSNVKTFISTHDAVIFCQKQLSIIRTKSGNLPYAPETIAKSTSGNENSAEIKYAETDAKIEIISVTDTKTTNANGDLNVVYEQNGESPVNNGNQTNSTDDDLRLQSHVRNRFVNIPNAQKPPLQTNPNGNDDITVGSSNNETYSE